MTFGFSQSVADLVTRLTWAFTERKTFNLARFSVLPFWRMDFLSVCVKSENSLPDPISQRFSTLF